MLRIWNFFLRFRVKNKWIPRLHCARKDEILFQVLKMPRIPEMPKVLEDNQLKKSAILPIRPDSIIICDLLLEFWCFIM